MNGELTQQVVQVHCGTSTGGDYDLALCIGYQSAPTYSFERIDGCIDSRPESLIKHASTLQALEYWRERAQSLERKLRGIL